MSSITNHPYRRLRRPVNAPFCLRPSTPGKGWGAFATREIKKGDLILEDRPLFTVRMNMTTRQIQEEELIIKFLILPSDQKQQISMLRLHGDKPFKDLHGAFNHNCTGMHFEDGRPGIRMYIMHSRFNHCCIPNANMPAAESEVCRMFASQDIAAGTEITFDYNPVYDMEARIAIVRHEALRFVCDCIACTPGTMFHCLSENRRRLIRGLKYHKSGRDIQLYGCTQLDNADFCIIRDPEVRELAETFSFPITSRFIHGMTYLLLIELEGVATPSKVNDTIPALMIYIKQFKIERNARIARLAMQQETWADRASVAFNLWGEPDAFDEEFAEQLQDPPKEWCGRKANQKYGDMAKKLMAKSKIMFDQDLD